MNIIQFAKRCLSRALSIEVNSQHKKEHKLYMIYCMNSSFTSTVRCDKTSSILLWLFPLPTDCLTTHGIARVCFVFHALLSIRFLSVPQSKSANMLWSMVRIFGTRSIITLWPWCVIQQQRLKQLQTSTPLSCSGRWLYQFNVYFQQYIVSFAQRTRMAEISIIIII